MKDHEITDSLFCLSSRFSMSQFFLCRYFLEYPRFSKRLQIRKKNVGYEKYEYACKSSMKIFSLDHD